MHVEISQDQMAMIRSGKPLRVTTEDTPCVVLRADIFDRLGPVFEDSGDSPRSLYPLVDRIMADDDANDPALESYLHYQRDS
jgi:hypothetical protein